MKYRILKVTILMILMITLFSFGINNNTLRYDTKPVLAYYEVNKSTGNNIVSVADNNPNLDYENLCSTNSGVSKTFRILGYVVLISKIVGPLIIIVIGILDLFKAMVSSDEDATSKSVMSLGRRIISGVLIFLIPTIIISLLKLLELTGGIEKDSSFVACTTCLFDVDNCKVVEEENPFINRGENNKSNSNTTTNNPTDYPEEDTKKTGDYEGIFTSHDLIIVNGIPRPITDFVDVDAMNKLLAETAVKSGLYTREGLVNIARALIETLENDYDYSIPYELGGMYHRGDTWGLDSTWGELVNGQVQGLDCRNFANWLFKQDGLALNRGFGYEGSTSRIGDNVYKNIEDGRPGDVVDMAGHIMVIIGKTENGFEIAESSGSGRVRIQEYTYSDLRRDGYHAYNMDNVYNDTGMYSTGKAYSAYADSFHIPAEQLPDSYKELIEEKAINDEKTIEKKTEELVSNPSELVKEQVSSVINNSVFTKLKLFTEKKDSKETENSTTKETEEASKKINITKEKED